MLYSRNTNYSSKRAPILFSFIHCTIQSRLILTSFTHACAYIRYDFSVAICFHAAFKQHLIKNSIALSIHLMLTSGMVECIRSHNLFMDKVQCTVRKHIDINISIHTEILHTDHSYAHANTSSIFISEFLVPFIPPKLVKKHDAAANNNKKV